MELVNFDMNLLTALDALLSEESVSRAAERLRVGQPAMSATLARLRASLGDPLLVRSGRGLQRTAFAESLREPLTAILGDVEQLIQSGAAFDPTTSKRSFTILASDYVALVLLRPLIERLGAIAPNVSVRVTPVDASLMESIRRGLVDVAIYPSELLPTDVPFRTQPLFDDDFVCVTDKANEMVGDVFTVEQLSSLPYLAASQGLLASLADQRLDEAHLARNTTMIAQSFVMAPFMLPGTKMYTILQRRLASLLMAEAHFKMLEPPVPIAAIHELMLWSPRRGADAGHAWLREQLQESARRLG
ncbi:LysR substrate-binding domain-containing protein [Microbacterium sp. 22215]|uniref:LysR family transcriptional regulator n=1 Tax=Microbacterium sp. 22215 TaxID=3453893 RepID=UPI003F84D29C